MRGVQKKGDSNPAQAKNIIKGHPRQLPGWFETAMAVTSPHVSKVLQDSVFTDQLTRPRALDLQIQSGKIP